MKSFIKIIASIIFLSGVAILLYVSQGINLSSDTAKQLTENYKKFARNSCDSPLVYTLGDIDPRFNLSNEEIISLLIDAEEIWESESGKDLFVFKSNAEDAVTVNFMFDERQAQIFASRTSEAILENKWDTYSELATVHEKLAETYGEALLKYNGNVTLYENKLKDFNDTVDEWNDNPGSSDEYRQLQKEEKQIKDLYGALEDDRESLNNTLDKLNQLVKEVNSIHDQLNTETNIHNSRFAGEEIVDAGDYGFYEINIYQFYSTPDLKLTLAHEMGHALGLDHTEDPESIMYYLLEDQNILDLKVSQEDMYALRELCDI